MCKLNNNQDGTQVNVADIEVCNRRSCETCHLQKFYSVLNLNLGLHETLALLTSQLRPDSNHKEEMGFLKDVFSEKSLSYLMKVKAYQFTFSLQVYLFSVPSIYQPFALAKMTPYGIELCSDQSTYLFEHKHEEHSMKIRKLCSNKTISAWLWVVMLNFVIGIRLEVPFLRFS